MRIYRTPLRYPGGKQRLTPFIIEILSENGLLDGNYVEPYAGGAGVAIELLLSHHVNRIHLNDSSYPIYAFWNAVLNNTDELCGMISRASLTIDEWLRRREVIRHPEAYDEIEVAFSLFYLNRCNRSGVISGGVIGGLDQTGIWKMDARFTRNTLINRIEAIASMRASISLSNMDAELYIINYVATLPRDSFVYCDPPYFEKSRRLYLDNYCKADHLRISRVIQENLRHIWVVSYDNAPEIIEYYAARRKIVYDLQYNAARCYMGQEVFVFSDDVGLPARSSLPSVNEALAAINR